MSAPYTIVVTDMKGQEFIRIRCGDVDAALSWYATCIEDATAEGWECSVDVYRPAFKAPVLTTKVTKGKK